MTRFSVFYDFHGVFAALPITKYEMKVIYSFKNLYTEDITRLHKFFTCGGWPIIAVIQS